MSFVAYTPTSYVLGVVLTIVFFLAVAGYLVGSFLADLVKAKVMLVGSVVYWWAALLNLVYVFVFYSYQPGGFQSVSVGLLFLMPLVGCADITYVIKYFVRRRRS
jgi:hypothetical protein